MTVPCSSCEGRGYHESYILTGGRYSDVVNPKMPRIDIKTYCEKCGGSGEAEEEKANG